MSTVFEATQHILSSTSPAKELALADDYMRLMRSQPDAFVLPAKHAHLAPIIGAFVGKPDGFHNFVRAVRDEMYHEVGPKDGRYIEMQEFFRTIEIRNVQNKRRERLGQAAEWFRNTYRTASTDQKNLWLRRLEQSWIKRRMQTLDAYKKTHRLKRISEDERRVLLDDFWAGVDQQIKNGDLPPHE